MADRTAKTILKYEVDRASQQQVIASANAVEGGLKGIGVAASNSLKRLRDEFVSGRREIDRERQSLDALEQDLRRIDRLEVRPTVSIEQGRARSGAALTDRAGSVLSQLSSGLGSGELANAAGLVGDLAGSVDDLGLKATATLGAVGLLGAGLTAVVGVIQKMVEEAQKEYDARVGVIKAIQDQTSAEANHAQAEAAIQRDNAQLALDYLEAQKAQQVALANSAGLNLEQFTGAMTKIEALNNLIREQEGIVTAANATIGIYNQLLAEGATLANDTAAAAANALARIEEANKITAESRTLIAELNREIAENSAAAIRNVLETIASGIGDIVSISEAYTAQAEKVATAQQAYNDTLAQGQATVTRLASDSQAKQNAILEDGYDRAADLAEQFGIDRAQAERDLDRELAKIDRDFARSAQEAAGALDAKALSDAITRHDDETEDAEQSAEDRADDRKKEYARAQRELAQSIDKRLRAERDALDRQLEQAETAWRAQLETRQQALNAEQAALNAFVNSTVNGMSVVQAATTAYTDFMNARVIEANDFLNMFVQEAIDRAAALNEITTQTGNTGAGAAYQGSVTGHALGGRFGAGQRSWVGERGPELVVFDRPGRVYNSQQSRGMASGAPSLQMGDIVNSFNGAMTQSEFKQAMIEVLQQEAV